MRLIGAPRGHNVHKGSRHQFLGQAPFASVSTSMRGPVVQTKVQAGANRVKVLTIVRRCLRKRSVSYIADLIGSIGTSARGRRTEVSRTELLGYRHGELMGLED